MARSTDELIAAIAKRGHRVSVGEPASPNALDRIEKALGRKLPPSYRECIDFNRQRRDGECPIVNYEHGSVQHEKPVANTFQEWLTEYFLDGWANDEDEASSSAGQPKTSS